MTNNNTTTNPTHTVNLPFPSPKQGEPLPSAAPPHSHGSDMSPLTAVLSLFVLIAIPALIYAFFFAINCRIPLRRSRVQQREAVDLGSSSSKDTGKQLEAARCGVVVKYTKEGGDHIRGEEEEYGGECPVCLSAFVEGDLLRQLSGCKHCFHIACIDKWLCAHSNCPVCRASVPPLNPPARLKCPAPRADEDFRQGLPDAGSLV